LSRASTAKARVCLRWTRRLLQRPARVRGTEEARMHYYSTNGQSVPVSFREAALTGLASDGGLFMPAEIPRLPADFWQRCQGMTLSEVAEEVAGAFLAGDIPRPELRAIVREALTFDLPLVELAPGRQVLELFHGPTLAFKDVGARFMARVFAY